MRAHFALIVSSALFITSSLLAYAAPAAEGDKPEAPVGWIKAEVGGTLTWRDAGGGYYIRVPLKEAPKGEIRVWLLYGEDKVTPRKLAEIKGRDVIAKGVLQQTPAAADGSRSVFPPEALYLRDFEIEAAKSK